MSMVLCKLPKAGLGNQLFPLLKAYTFASLNNLPVIVTGYHQLKIGPWLRGEKTKRNYRGFFTFQKNLLAALKDYLRITSCKYPQVMEPVVEKIEGSQDKLYVFDAMPHWDNYFDGLKENRTLVKQIFQQLVSKKVYKKISNQPSPYIGVHIRMGDFRKLKPGEDFNTTGIVRTPETYFMNIINTIRQINGSCLPVSIFTDGYAEEFDKLFTLDNIQLIEGNSDLADLVLLSKSKIIVTSATSTFSYWAGFLSDAIVIVHPAHINTVIRSGDKSTLPYEGFLDTENTLLSESIKRIA